jgi:hypothetical protein
MQSGENIDAVEVYERRVCNHGIHVDDYCRDCVREAAEYERKTGQPIISGADE